MLGQVGLNMAILLLMRHIINLSAMRSKLMNILRHAQVQIAMGIEDFRRRIHLVMSVSIGDPKLMIGHQVIIQMLVFTGIFAGMVIILQVNPFGAILMVLQLIGLHVIHYLPMHALHRQYQFQIVTRFR